MDSKTYTTSSFTIGHPKIEIIGNSVSTRKFVTTPRNNTLIVLRAIQNPGVLWGMNESKKIKVYVKSLDEPVDMSEVFGKIAKAYEGVNDPITTTMRNMFLRAASSNVHAKSGSLASFFDPSHLGYLWSVKRTAKEHNCDYEFIDVRTGNLLEVDDELPPIKEVRIIGQYALIQEENNLPVPCCKVDNQILELSYDNKSEALLQKRPSIKEFYVKSTEKLD